MSKKTIELAISETDAKRLKEALPDHGERIIEALNKATGKDTIDYLNGQKCPPKESKKLNHEAKSIINTLRNSGERVNIALGFIDNDEDLKKNITDTFEKYLEATIKRLEYSWSDKNGMYYFAHTPGKTRQMIEGTSAALIEKLEKEVRDNSTDFVDTNERSSSSVAIAHENTLGIAINDLFNSASKQARQWAPGPIKTGLGIAAAGILFAPTLTAAFVIAGIGGAGAWGMYKFKEGGNKDPEGKKAEGIKGSEKEKEKEKGKEKKTAPAPSGS